MGIFDMGMGEILLVIVVALIIWGPNKIPEIARTVGRAVGMLRKASLDLTTEIKKELEIEEPDSLSQPETNPVIKADEAADNDIPNDGDTKQADKNSH